MSITNRQDGNNELLAATPSGAIAAGDISFDAASGILTISPAGGASLVDFQQVLRSVTYNNIAGSADHQCRPIGHLRRQRWCCSIARFGSPTVAVLPISPGLTLDLDGSAAGTGFAASFVEAGVGPGSGPVNVVDTDVTITAPNNLVRATITLDQPAGRCAGGSDGQRGGTCPPAFRSTVPRRQPT